MDGHNYPGIYINLEGGEGSGKTTQRDLLTKYLEEVENRQIVYTREPGGTEAGEQIRTILHDPRLDLNPVAEAYGYAFARAQSLREVVEPALREGRVVIADRSFLSSLAYQGFGRKADWELIWGINKAAVGNLIPDAVFYLKVDPEVGLSRRRYGDQSLINKMDLMEIEFYHRVAEGYDFLAKESPFSDRFFTVDAEQSVEQIAEIVHTRVHQLLIDRELGQETAREVSFRGKER